MLTEKNIPSRVHLCLSCLSFTEETWMIIDWAAIARLLSIALENTFRNYTYSNGECEDNKKDTFVFFTQHRSQALRTCFRLTRKTRWSRLSSPVREWCSNSEKEATAKLSIVWGKPLGRSFGCCQDIVPGIQTGQVIIIIIIIILGSGNEVENLKR